MLLALKVFARAVLLRKVYLKGLEAVPMLLTRTIRRRLLRVAIVVIVAILILLLRFTEEIGPEKSALSRFLVARVIDGDTVELLGGDRLRLTGIDAPEHGDLFSDEATAFLRRHAVGRTANITYGNRRRDRYGRLLGYVYVNDFFVNKALIDSGLATVYLFKDNDPGSEQVKELIAAQRSAMSRKVGQWSLVHEPEETYIHLDGSFRLHRPSCRSVAHRKPGRFEEFKTREEGLAGGLSPCRNCRP